MKRILQVLAMAVLFLSTFVVPPNVLADGGAGGTNCGGGNNTCKP